MLYEDCATYLYENPAVYDESTTYDVAMTFSIVITTYNRGPAIKATIDSALAQELHPESFEILIIDDGSTDGTWDFLKANYEGHKQIRLLRTENRGVAHARNLGLEEARGEFIAYLDHDDLWMPRKLIYQWYAFHSNPIACVVYCKWNEIDDDGQELPADNLLWKQPCWTPAQGKVLDSFLMKNPIVSMSVPLIRKGALKYVGGFDPKTAPADDWDVWLRLAAQFEFDFIDHILVSYRRHAKQQSKDEYPMWRGSHRATIKHWKQLLSHPRRLVTVLGSGYWLRTVNPYYQTARRAVEAGDWREVRNQFWKCWCHFPLMLFTMQWLYLLKRYLTKDARPL